MSPIKISLSIFCMLAVLPLSQVYASTLDDVKSVLASFENTTPLDAQLQLTTHNIHGEDDDAQESQGEIEINVRSDENGLSLTYSPRLLAQLDSEAQAKAEDPNQLTPTVDASWRLGANEIKNLTASNISLLRRLNKSELISEEQGEFQGKPATVLTLALGNVLSERDKKYVKKFSARLTLWLDENKVPVASETAVDIKGRAFLVVRFKSQQEGSAQYAVHGDRFITVQQIQSEASKGGGESNQSRTEKRLLINDDLKIKGN